MISPKWQRSLRFESLPENVRKAEYAVRGEIVIKSFALQKRLDNGEKLPFTRLVKCNIGNPQSVGQNPLTFHRQLLSLLTNPHAIPMSTLPADVVNRAKEYIKAFPKFGAYSNSKGIKKMRQEVAKFIDRRDGVTDIEKTDIEHLFLTDGASSGVKAALELLVASKKDGVLIPIPQYPLYSASVIRLGGTWVGYELSEDYTTHIGWDIDIEEIKRNIAKFEIQGNKIKALVVINPGNPTGNVLTRKSIEQVIRLCEEHNIVILADEVYQANVYANDKQFFSFRKVVLEMNAKVELFSFHSISKGYYAECGLRGGYIHATNIDPLVLAQLYKLFSMNLCSNTLGQAMVASIMNPPNQGDESYALFKKERDDIYSSLKKKAVIVEQKLNSMNGVQCMPVEGAMYAFPQITFPQLFLEEAKKKGKSPDFLYCVSMMEKTGVVCVPGQGFNQKPGTFHYRMTILPEEKLLLEVFEKIIIFHNNLMSKYSSSVALKANL